MAIGSLRRGLLASTALSVTAVMALSAAPAMAQDAYWNGPAVAGPAPGPVTGGTGTWNAVNGNWSNASGTVNAPVAHPIFAIFQAAPGVVTVDNSFGAIGVTGMRFATSGYLITGGDIGLTSPQSMVAVGDGTPAGGAMTATIFSGLVGAGGLRKTDRGTLILAGANSYAGATVVDGGVLQGGAGNTFSQASATTVNAGGTLDLGGFAQAIDSVSLAGGTLRNGALTGAISSTGGTVVNLSGIASLTAMAGMTTLAGANSYVGATTITGGTLTAGNANAFSAGSATTVATGGTLDLGGFAQTINSVSLAGGTLRNGTFTGLVSSTGGSISGLAGTAALTKSAGTTVLTGLNTYTGATNVTGGTLTANTANAFSPASATRVTAGGTLDLGGFAQTMGSVTLVGGALSVTSGSTASMASLQLDGAATLKIVGNTPSIAAPVNVTGNLTLDGTLNISNAGPLGAGIHRLLDYGGILTHNGMDIGLIPPGMSLADLSLQTGIAGQVNLVNSAGFALAFWNGAAVAGPGTGTVTGGTGTWVVPSANWTDANGNFNAPAMYPVFAVFQGTPGTVTVDDSAGAITASGMQFATSGYLVTGDAITITEPLSTVRVGDGTLAGAGYTATIASPLVGAGGLRKADRGTLVLSGFNSYAGVTSIEQGTLRMGASTALPIRTAVQISAGAGFDLDGFSQMVGSLAGVGSVTLGGATLTVGRDNTTTTYSGSISGAGSLIKTGTGTLTLSGNSAYSSSTEVAGGGLVVNGSLAAPVIVRTGATLGGSGSVGATTVDGTLSPGNSPGTLTVNGNLVMGAGSTYIAELQGAVADRVGVTGAASLAGTLRIVPLGGAYLFNSPYMLLSATGGISGSFSTVDATGAFGDGVTTTVGYSASAVQLTLAPKPLVPIVDPVTPSVPGPSPEPGPSPAPSPRFGVTAPSNVYAVASAIDGAVGRGADASPLFALYNQPASATPAAVNQLSGEVHTAAPALGLRAANQFLGAMLDPNGRGRLAGPAGGPTGAAGYSADPPSKRSEAGPSSFDPARFSLWGATFGSRGRSEGERDVGSANRTLDDAHLAVGADILIAPGTVAGVAVAGGQTRASLSGGLGKIESDVFQAGLYGQTRIGPVSLAAAGGYAKLDNDVHRAVPVLGNALTSSYASTAWSGRLLASAELARWNGFTLSPLAALQAVQVRSPAVLERAGLGGSAGGLSLAGRNDLTSRSELGAQIDGQAVFGAVPVTGFARASWARYFERDASLTAGLIALPGASFTVSGARPDRNAALLAAGLDAKLSDRISLGIRLDSELSANTRSLGGTARLAVSF